MDKSRLLVVEDDQALLDALTETLRAEGYLAQPAISGDVALVLLQQRVPFRLVITDIVLPGLLDGFALARRAREFYPGIPIIYTTGFPQVAHIRAHGAPYGDILVKPSKTEALLMTVATALGKSLDSISPARAERDLGEEKQSAASFGPLISLHALDDQPLANDRRDHRHEQQVASPTIGDVGRNRRQGHF